MTKQVKADIALLLVTLGWGSSFLLTKNSIDKMPTYNFLAIRFFIAFFISTIIFFKQMRKIGKRELIHGTWIGALLFSTYALQTVGLNYTTVSKSAFITGFNVVLVPVFTTLIMKNRPDRKSYLSVAVAFAGLSMLTLNHSVTGINIGDIYTFICAIITAFYIILVGKYTVNLESIPFAIIQIGVVGVLSLMASLFTEKPIIPADYHIWVNIVILSVVCTSGAFIIQNVAQKFTSPTHTALIYTGEPVFAAIFAYIATGETLTVVGFIGAVMILLGMLVSEVDLKQFFSKSKVSVEG